MNIQSGGDKVEFMEKFKNAVSKGFDPDVHLVKVGLANQTTMYKRETKAIGRLLEVCIYIYIDVYVYVYKYVYTYIFIYMCIYINIYVYISYMIYMYTYFKYI
jgi:hypothetical protein